MWDADAGAAVAHLDRLVSAGYELSDAEQQLRADITGYLEERARREAESDEDADRTDDEEDDSEDEYEDSDADDGEHDHQAASGDGH